MSQGGTATETIGQLLREARQEKEMSAADVSAKTRIPERYLALFEETPHGDLPEDAYTKIYFKAYCKFLGFDGVSLTALRKSRRGTQTDRTAPRPAMPPSRRQVSRPASFGPRRHHPTAAVPASELIVAPRLLRNAALAVMAVALSLYCVIGLTRIFAAPAVTLLSPRDGLVTAERTITIEGKTRPEAHLEINGKRVTLDSDGVFRDTIELQAGLNLVTVSASKKHSDPTIIARRVIMTPRERAPQPE